MRSFASFHPIILFLYYVFVVIITVFMMHPFVLVSSVIGSLLFYYMVTKRAQFWRDIGFYLLVFLLIALTNPIFVHKGETILFFYNDHPVTLEAMMYGIVIATMLIAIIFWSKAFSYMMTSDKFIYLFGKTIPKLSLVLSMALKFIPLFKAQIKKVHATQRTLGLYTSDSMTDRFLSSIRTFNSILTWSLENAIHQADAMKARGYGLKGRTNFSIFTFQKRDGLALAFILLLFLGTMIAYVYGMFQFFYYPLMDRFTVSKDNIVQLFIVFVLFVFPFIYEVKEHIQWKLLQSKMSASPIQMQMKK